MPSTPAQPTDAPAPVDSAKPEAGAPAWSGEFQACPSDVKSGMMHCFSETTWGICNGGWAFVSNVAEGTKCIDGAIAAE
ncbi:spore coat SP96 precursor [Fusarium mexicanum]|uniref:Spore coat SP96 n=1 Tax=Fusarium mexicanum TaxID=751941 RepID=A0A8H5MKW8_9HYPO|nr:spore coat SP96 precursor [Fusarium mexicanum]